MRAVLCRGAACAWLISQHQEDAAGATAPAAWRSGACCMEWRMPRRMYVWCCCTQGMSQYNGGSLAVDGAAVCMAGGQGWSTCDW